MQKRCSWAGGVILGIGLFLINQPVHALFTRLTPLKEVLGVDYIFLAKVEKIDPGRPAVVLQVMEDLKGQAPFRRMPINLTGDSESQKNKHSEQLLKRLAPDLPILVFAASVNKGKRYTAFAYTNGTWFQILGQVDEKDSNRVHWSFTHCEIYLRGTFKGTTAELKQVVIDGLKGARTPPEPDAKEPPGMGPEVSSGPKVKQSKIEERGSSDKPVLAVIPTIGILGPLAILAMLFPAVFGPVLIVLRRWLVLLTVLGVNSTLLTLYFWFHSHINRHWWGSLSTLWITMAVVTLAGALWAWRRHRSALKAGQLPETQPRRSEMIALWVLSLCMTGMLVVFCCVSREGKSALFHTPCRELMVLSGIVWIGTFYMVYVRATSRRPGARMLWPTELIILWGLGLACVALGATIPHAMPPALAFETSESSGSPSGDHDYPVLAADTVALGTSPGAISPLAALAPLLAATPSDLSSPRPTGVAWVFEPEDRGTIVSSPRLEGNRVYVGAAHRKNIVTYGRLYCLDGTTAKEIWHFDDDEGMKQVFSSPCLAGGRVYIGEGFHQDDACKLYCLDAATGTKAWEFQTKSHTESSPCVVGNQVFFGAGDDGVYCLNAATGEQVWHFEGLHVDTSPAVIGSRLFAGNGYGDHYEMFCLDATTGKPIWRTNSSLPVFGSPTVASEFVFFGTGNGDFLKSADHPAGALVCLEANTGKQVWRCEVPDAVLAKAAVDSDRVYFTSRDRHCYAVDLRDGGIRWKLDLGSPVLASPALVGSSLYVAASDGRVCCVDVHSGQPSWTFELAKLSRLRPQLFSSPSVSVSREGNIERRHIVFGAGLDDQFNMAAKVYCLEDQRVEK